MTLTLEISPEVEAQIERAAAVEKAAHVATFDAIVDALAEEESPRERAGLGALPNAALSRAAFYAADEESGV